MKIENRVDMMLARAQVGLAFLFSVGFFGVLFFLMCYHKEMSPTEVTILTGLVSVLGTLLALQMNFFYARTRPQALPDPSMTNISTPSAVTASITAPAADSAPLVQTPEKQI